MICDERVQNIVHTAVTFAAEAQCSGEPMQKTGSGSITLRLSCYGLLDSCIVVLFSPFCFISEVDIGNMADTSISHK